MNKYLKSLAGYGLLGFGREKAVHDLLKHITNAELVEEENKSIIKLKKGSKKFTITVTNKGMRSKGDAKPFMKELERLEKDCLHEYAVSVRSKKELLMNYSTGAFVKFILVPVILEVYNVFKLKPKKYCEILNTTPAEQKFLIFKTKKNVKAVYENKTLIINLERSEFTVKLKRLKPNPDLLDKNFDVSRYQNHNRDAFFAGLPYILEVLNGKDFEYSFEGDAEGLKQICKTMLEALYKYLMIENV
jgi:hypothetical protein